MLSTPKHGWSNISIGNWSERCSYLDDVPFTLLRALEKVCRTRTVEAVKFDAEGYEYIVVFDNNDVHIISNNSEQGYIYVSIEANVHDLAKELVSDIRKDIDYWSSWNNYGSMSTEEMAERKQGLIILCDNIEKRIS